MQVKTRATLPGWLWAAVDQAARDAGPDEAPAVVLSEVTAGRKARRLVVLGFADFAALIGGTDRAPPATGGATMAPQQTRTATRTTSFSARPATPDNPPPVEQNPERLGVGQTPNPPTKPGQT